MKVLLINGSPKAHGCTQAALDIIDKYLQEEGIETEHIHIGHKNIRGCIACMKCKEKGECIFKDVVNDVAAKFKEADGIVIGTPVYYAGMAGTVKAFLDRLFWSTSFDKSFKVGAAVVTSRRAGSITTFDTINHYFTHGGMPVASSRYWNEVHGMTYDDVAKDIEGVQVMRVLARNMAFLIKSIALGKEHIGLPVKESERIATSFIK